MVGNIAKDLGLEKSTLNDRKYRIVSSNADPLFHVNQNDGVLYVSRKIDREEVCAHSSTCLINLKTVLENPLEVHYVRIEVLDINDHSPNFPERETTLEISESVLPGARFQLKPSRDRDSGHFSVQQYKLSQNDHFRLEVKDKGDDGKIPILVVQKSLDRETAVSHSLVLTALDGGKPPKSVKVLDINDNAPVFAQDMYSVMIDENAPVGTTVIQVNATDLDEGPNGEVVYSFSSIVNRKLLNLLDINPSTGEILVKGVAPLATQKSVIIKIVDVNDNAPEIEVTSFSSSIPEDSRPGTTVALISVNDLDSGLNGKVICAKQTQYDLTITAKDAGQPSLSSEKTISVVVSDVNDNSPEFSLSPYTFYVTEANEPVNEGTMVGNIAKDLGLDKSTLNDRKYRIVSSNADPLFHVNQNDGVLYVSRKIDREEVCAQSNTCLMNLKTVLENPLEVHYVGVEILDINDHSPSFPDEEKTLEISESVLPGARFQLKPSRDRDSGHFSVQQYKLSQNDHFRLEVRDKGEDGKIPILVLQKSLDREAAGSNSLVLTALDGGEPPKYGTMNILVKVLDVNDNVPVFSKDIYSVTLYENVPVGTTVIQVNATDLDEGQNGEVYYSFGNSVSNTVFKLFHINPSTGEIIAKGLIDYEKKDKYEIEIQASDKGVAPLTTEKSVVIQIVDVNDNAPEIEVTSFSSSIPEDSRPGTTVALISEDVPFALSPSLQENIYSLVTKSLLDREKQTQYDLTITAKDAGQPSLSSDKTISVVVSDVNDNSPEFSLSPYTFYVTEANEPGTSVFSLKAFDRDENDNARVSYHILRDGSKENKVTSFLNINSETGDILALKSFDFETLKTFQFQVVATDSGTPSLSSNVTVNVFILDQNDNAPVILNTIAWCQYVSKKRI
uniref:Protocadherin 2 alpha a 15 n=1 Tax=Sander lucioperca TaxID=283035 RepID=A0A8C9XFA8_SANLU